MRLSTFLCVVSTFSCFVYCSSTANNAEIALPRVVNAVDNANHIAPAATPQQDLPRATIQPDHVETTEPAFGSASADAQRQVITSSLRQVPTIRRTWVTNQTPIQNPIDIPPPVQIGLLEALGMLLSGVIRDPVGSMQWVASIGNEWASHLVQNPLESYMYPLYVGCMFIFLECALLYLYQNDAIQYSTTSRNMIFSTSMESFLIFVKLVAFVVQLYKKFASCNFGNRFDLRTFSSQVGLQVKILFGARILFFLQGLFWPRLLQSLGPFLQEKAEIVGAIVCAQTITFMIAFPILAQLFPAYEQNTRPQVRTGTTNDANQIAQGRRLGRPALAAQQRNGQINMDDVGQVQQAPHNVPAARPAEGVLGMGGNEQAPDAQAPNEQLMQNMRLVGHNFYDTNFLHKKLPQQRQL